MEMGTVMEMDMIILETTKIILHNRLEVMIHMKRDLNKGIIHFRIMFQGTMENNNRKAILFQTPREATGNNGSLTNRRTFRLL